MTITSSRYVEQIPAPEAMNSARPPKESPRIWHAIEPPFKESQSAPSEAYAQSAAETTIVIDNGKRPKHTTI